MNTAIAPQKYAPSARTRRRRQKSPASDNGSQASVCSQGSQSGAQSQDRNTEAADSFLPRAVDVLDEKVKALLNVYTAVHSQALLDEYALL